MPRSACRWARWCRNSPPLLARGGEDAAPDRARTAEIRIGPPANRRTLLAQHRRRPQASAGRRRRIAGFVLTFDDITELLSAQRKAAWADVARRIAHEIKNPLTPIQLSAERLKRRFAQARSPSDPETFIACTDTIVRQVGDIGRMVDEFSAFARMPQPVIKPEDLSARCCGRRWCCSAMRIPRSTTRPTCRSAAPVAPCDRRLIGQALTNLLKNAADAIAMRAAARPGRRRAIGRLSDTSPCASSRRGQVAIAVEDDGIGLPQGEDRDRLTEPYVTHKPKGTGLGLAIVKKIMEDHGGRLDARRPRAGAGLAGNRGRGPAARPAQVAA